MQSSMTHDHQKERRCQAAAEREPNGDAPTEWRCTDRMGMHRQVNRGKKAIDWRNYRNTND